MASEKVQTESKQISYLSGDTAIIGMACLFPKAPDLQTFWQNIVLGVDAITEVKPERWDPEIFYDENPDSENKIYCKRGGYIDDFVEFNPLDYGIMPIAVEGGEPDQFLAMRVAYEALADAGYSQGDLQPQEKERTKVVLGRGNYLGHGNANIIQHTGGVEQFIRLLRKLHPEYSEHELQAISRSLLSSLPRSGPENAPSMMPNMTTGRVTNRLDFMGANYTIDAACASTLIATEIGVRDLLTRNCDTSVVGGIHVCMEVPFLIVFCKLRAMSPSCEIRSFDRKADGLVPGEGVGIMILKRLEDAERDGDRIYAVIKGVGTSSDGRGSSVAAPRVEGEVLALLRAYEMAGIDPNSVELIEGHGTATSAGDAAELEALARVLGERDESLPPRCALGSVKSMIGHTMPAAGAAGMIKAALALYHKVLPPTLHCDEPNPKIDWSKSAFYINTETRPWIHGGDTPRRVGVNAFGFGGVNGHVILEEYPGTDEEKLTTLWQEWDSEVVILQSESRQALIQRVRQLQQYLTTGPPVLLKDLAYTLNVGHARTGDTPYRLAMVADSVEDLQEKLGYSVERLSDPDCRKIKYAKGVFFFEEPLAEKGKLAFLFPGEGGQYLNMLADLCMHFPEVRRFFDESDRASGARVGGDGGNSYLPSQIVFPPPFFSEEERQKAEERIWEMGGAIQAVLASNWALNTVLTSLDIHPDMVVGHSTGEFSAMIASGALAVDEGNLDEYTRSLDVLDYLYKKADASADIPKAVIVAVGADYDTVSSIAHGIDGGIYVAMDNCPHQVVVVCPEVSARRREGVRRDGQSTNTAEPYPASSAAAEQFMAELQKRGTIHEKLVFDRAYHTPMFRSVCEVLLDHFQQWDFETPHTPVYSCATTSPYPDDPQAVLRLAVEQWMRPVEFRKTIEAMYEAGARIFVEVGPRGNLTAFVDDILRDREYLAMPANLQRRSGITQLNYLVGILAAHGVPMRLDYLYQRRSPKLLSLNAEEDRKLLEAYADDSYTIDLKLGFPELSVERYLLAKEKAGQQPAVSHESLAGSDASRGVGDFPLLEETHVVESQEQSAVQQRSVEPTSQHPASSVQHQASSIISQYLQTMEHFLEVQEEVMQTYLGNGGNAAPQALESPRAHGSSGVSLEAAAQYAAPSSQHPEFPFIGEIVSHIPGRELVALREVSLDEDIFLHDHTFGGKISVHETLRALSIIPMTIGMEMMAEAAALLQPGRLLIGMRRIQASQWIRVARKPITLQFTAQVQASEADAMGNEVRVQIRDLGENVEQAFGKLEQRENPEVSATAAGSPQPLPVIEGVMVFGDAYPEPPPVGDLALKNGGPCKRTAQQLYEERIVFHGPRFQIVASLDESSPDGIKATFETPGVDNLFRSSKNPHLITNPVLLDAVAQVLGYWAFEQLETDYTIFPFRLHTLSIYRPNLPAKERVNCQMQIRQLTAKRIRVDADMIDAGGRIWMRLAGLEDWRFPTIGVFYDFWKFPNKTIMSKPFSELAPMTHSQESLQRQQLFECYLIGKPPWDLLGVSQAIWIECWMHQILNHQERQTYRNLKWQESKKNEWLLGRMAAKDAVRVYVKKRYGIELYPADIEISNDEYGRPVLRGYWTKDIGFAPGISISHSNNAAGAIVGRGRFLGIDIEKISERGRSFGELAFTKEEQVLLAESLSQGYGGSSPSPDQRAELETRFWCVKEAVAKALGRRFIKSPLDLAISSYEDKSQELGAQTGIAKVVLRRELPDEFQEYVPDEITAYTNRYEDYIMATTIEE